MRFDDRVTGTLATYATKAKKIHIEVDPAGGEQECESWMWRWLAICAKCLNCCCRALGSRGQGGRDGSAWLKTIEASKGGFAVHDIKNLPDSGHLRGACDA